MIPAQSPKKDFVMAGVRVSEETLNASAATLLRSLAVLLMMRLTPWISLFPHMPKNKHLHYKV